MYLFESHSKLLCFIPWVRWADSFTSVTNTDCFFKKKDQSWEHLVLNTPVIGS